MFKRKLTLCVCCRHYIVLMASADTEENHIEWLVIHLTFSSSDNYQLLTTASGATSSMYETMVKSLFTFM
jgi:hypothetical protein